MTNNLRYQQREAAMQHAETQMRKEFPFATEEMHILAKAWAKSAQMGEGDGGLGWVFTMCYRRTLTQMANPESPMYGYFAEMTRNKGAN